MGVYERIVDLCVKSGKAQTVVEAELGFSRGSIGKLQKYGTSYDRLKAYADYFGVTVPYLTGETDTPYPTTKDIINSDVSIKTFANFPDNEIAQTVLIQNLCEKVKITQKEIDMIIAFRNADEYDQMTVLRTLHLNKQAEEEKKASSTAI